LFLGQNLIQVNFYSASKQKKGNVTKELFFPKQVRSFKTSEEG